MAYPIEKKLVIAISSSNVFDMVTVDVHEVFRGETVWQGDVEVFDLTGHPKAKRAYAWSHLDGDNDERTRFVAVLEIPPVISAETAVRVSIVRDVRKTA